MRKMSLTALSVWYQWYAVGVSLSNLSTSLDNDDGAGPSVDVCGCRVYRSVEARTVVMQVTGKQKIASWWHPGCGTVAKLFWLQFPRHESQKRQASSWQEAGRRASYICAWILQKTSLQLAPASNKLIKTVHKAHCSLKRR